MNLKLIKNYVGDNIGRDVKVVCNCARNKKELYYGTITETYNYIFIVKLRTNENKSFCYSDVLTNCVELYFN